MDRLSPDVLDSMLANEHISHLAVRLWKTGNKSLMSRLASGLTRLELRPSSNDFKVPSMVSELRRLRHFAISSNSCSLTDPSLWSNTLKWLPQTLETLELNFEGVHNVFWNYGPDLDNPSSSLIASSYPRGVSHYVDLNAMFPSLISLKLENFEEGDYNDLYPALPSSLTALSTSQVSIHSSPFASLLPKSLKRLDCSLNFEENTFSDDWLHGPPDLQYIGDITLPAIADPVGWIPKSLTSAGQCIMELDPSHPPVFPTTALQDLYIMLNDESPPTTWPTCLPRYATKLFFEDYFTPAEVSHLPWSVKCLKLSLKYPHWEHMGSNEGFDANAGLDALRVVWPPNLTELVVNVGETSPDFIMTLPHTLKSLDLQCYWLSGPLNLDLLSPLLRTIKLQVDAPLRGNWPNQLESLTLSHKSTFKNCPTFPPTLTQFGWSMINEWNEEEPDLSLMKNRPFLLPPSVTRMKVDAWHSAWFPLLPHSLTDLDILFLTSSDNDKEDYFKKLPPTLTQLTIVDGRDLELSSTSLASLVHLNALSLNSVNIPSAFLEHLPRKMHTLRVESVTHLEPLHLRFLPTLSECRLFIDWSTPSIADHWPPTFARFIPDEQQEIKEKVTQRLRQLDY